MYNSPRRRGGSNRPADARARRVPADYHEGSCRDFLRRHERESADAARRDRPRANRVRRVSVPQGGRFSQSQVCDRLSRLGGRQLPGAERPDARRAGRLGTMGARPGRSARSYGPAGTDRGRTARCGSPRDRAEACGRSRIRNVEDRVVERAIVQVVQPFLDPTFAAASFGYRPGRGREHALAHAEAMADAKGSWVWVFDDVKDAFDHVPLGAVARRRPQAARRRARSSS